VRSSRTAPAPRSPAPPRSHQLQAGVPEFLRNDPAMSGPITESGAWRNWWEQTGSQPPVPADAPNAFPLPSAAGPARPAAGSARPAAAPARPAAPAPRSRRGRREEEAELSFDDLRPPDSERRGSRIDSASGTYSRLRPPPEPPAAAPDAAVRRTARPTSPPAIVAIPR